MQLKTWFYAPDILAIYVRNANELQDTIVKNKTKRLKKLT